MENIGICIKNILNEIIVVNWRVLLIFFVFLCFVNVISILLFLFGLFFRINKSVFMIWFELVE